MNQIFEKKKAQQMNKDERQCLSADLFDYMLLIGSNSYFQSLISIFC